MILPNRLSVFLIVAIAIITMLLSTPGVIYAGNGDDSGANPGSTSEVVVLNVVDRGDDAAKAMVKTAFGEKGDEVVSHMIHRVSLPTYYVSSKSPTPRTTDSPPWSGYQVIRTQADIRGVTGHFMARTALNGSDYAWVGVGTNPLAQIGVDMAYHHDSTVSITPFWEVWPDFGMIHIVDHYDQYGNPVYWNVPAGHTLIATVYWDSGEQEWFFFINDVDTGKYSAFWYDCSPNRDSAEWIVGVPAKR
ncbi:MAG: G1 family endopeptidase [Dehalococcoidia bacterium]|nr:G1 family endopeptidase [Dehalococcoidia bacterium]